jgi:serine/threonine protein kinase
MRQIGQYEVEHEIGRGGMAVVYLARQLGLDRAVALKELAGLHATDPTATSRFVREARLAGSLNHRNIVTVYEYLEHGGVPYIAMEFLPSGSLRPLVGALSLVQTLGVLDGILAGLAHACEHGIVHRDLKPENVMRSDDGSVKIADFGIAKAQDDVANANLTPAGEFVGAPAYVSPEQVLGAEATAASDLYAVGVIAYELLTGEAPFAGTRGASAILIRKVNERPPSLRARRQDLDRGLAEWVDRLLERDPAKRPSEPQKVRRSLEEIADRVLGPHWQRDSPLPEGLPPRNGLPRVTPPHRFVPLQTLREHAQPVALAANALTRPWTIAVTAAVVIAAVAFTPWLFLVAAGVFVALGGIAFFDEGEAVRTGRRRPQDA